MAKSSNDDAADALAAMTGGNPPAAPDLPSQGDEDTVAAPAPDISVFAPRQRTSDLIVQRNLRTHRTAIPILLTTGVLLWSIGLLKWLTPQDSPFAQWPIAMPIVMFVVGLGLLALAYVNMIHVRTQLSRPRHGV